MNIKVPYLFSFLALSSLLLATFLGCIAATQYIFHDFLKEYLSFSKIRPLHVSTAVSWIILAPTAIIYRYLQTKHNMKGLFSRTSFWHFIIFLISGILVISLLMMGKFGGREYFAFPPLVSILFLLGWILFALIFFRTLYGKIGQWPVFLWMWATGISFFIFTLIEAHLWLIPYFRDNIIRDMTVQWKAYGTLIGSWNMLVYGTAMYIMYSIHPDEKLIKGKMSFLLFFIGLLNLLFGWAHHTYILPAQPWIRNIAYFVSMTELIVLGIIIWNWQKSIKISENSLHLFSCKFLKLSDFWILINLILAITISIPAVNYFTHGTHITVAHAMGATIGINSTILMAALFYMANQALPNIITQFSIMIKRGFYIFQISLLIFWLSLVASGIIKINWMYGGSNSPFSTLHESSIVYFTIFLISGIGILVGLLHVTFPLFKILIEILVRNKKPSHHNA